MRRHFRLLVSTTLIGSLCGWAIAADPDDTVLVTQSGPNQGLWRLAHIAPAWNPLDPESSLIVPEGKPDHGGSTVFNDTTLTPNPNLPPVTDVNEDGIDDIVRVGEVSGTGG